VLAMRAWVRTGLPRALRDHDEWLEMSERLVRATELPDYTFFWWKIRPHPRLGTLEVRMPDQPTALARTVSFAALVQALAAAALEAPPAPPCDRGYYAQNRWAAARFGPQAELIHPDATRALHAPELWAELLELLRPAARRLGTLELLEQIDPASCEADLQLAIGEPRAIAADLVRRTLI
jgi:glutamate---cysteine ligase / carboxylate-amine ligase